MEFLLLILVSVVGVTVALLLIPALLRIDSVFEVRMWFIDDEAMWPDGYYALPSFAEMVFHPKHWHRWTKAQWVAYANRVTKK